MRKFAQISESDLQTKILSAVIGYDSIEDIGYEWELLTDIFAKDLKVSFDFENSFVTDGDPGPTGMNGFHTLENGFTFCGVSAGGDWEDPVFFVVYWDGKDLRAYIPKLGNLWNQKLKTAYGNNEESDKIDQEKRKDLLKDQYEHVDYNPAEIKKDLLNHFTLI
jgi:hypothetical protein